MLSIVVAIADNNVIGKEKSLAWYLPNDLKKFKDITMTGSKTMIMGRKTFESLPKVLPERKHIILTNNKDYKVMDENVKVVTNLHELKPYIEAKEEYFVIGGGQIFKLLFPYTNKMYITEIHENFEGDTFFPEYDKTKWEVIENREGIVDDKSKYKHNFLTLVRI
ncbi:dihydrofolate reductase [Candidatus Clostridium radicumherbarum]|uniref:Dihydrofolate reductase n=1 Tax=Candidatus Clostridium radicumherbarum TaxID=3381662 RepID=A0ABW8TY12_9CLOT